MIESIKKFLNKYNLEWKGHIATIYSPEFYNAGKKDFKEKEIVKFLIYTGENKCLEVYIEIDIATFEVVSIKEKDDNGIERNVEIESIIEKKDLSQEWIKFQLSENSLIYAVALKEYCEKHKKRINLEYDKKVEKIKKRLDAVDEYRVSALKKYEDIEGNITDI